MIEPANDFAELIARVRAGDEAAVAQLVRQYESQVRRVARLRLGPLLRRVLDSMDIAQSVHRILLHGLHRGKFVIDTPEQLIALLARLVKWKVARLWRHHQLEHRPAPAGVGRSAPVPADPAETAACRDAVAQLLEGLPLLDRQLIELRLQGCSTAEAAAKLGCDARILRARLSRLRQRLRENGWLSQWS